MEGERWAVQGLEGETLLECIRRFTLPVPGPSPAIHARFSALLCPLRPQRSQCSWGSRNSAAAATGGPAASDGHASTRDVLAKLVRVLTGCVVLPLCCWWRFAAPSG